jgi:hypothetical protein
MRRAIDDIDVTAVGPPVLGARHGKVLVGKGDTAIVFFLERVFLLARRMMETTSSSSHLT